MKLIIFRTKYVFIGVGLLFLLFATSCEKYVDINTPPNVLGSDKAFVDSSSATATVLGIYSGLASGTSSVVFSVIKYGAMSADEGYYLSNTSFDAFRDNTLAAGNAANGFWGALYTRINRANNAIEGIAASLTLSEAVKNQLLGEAKFLRAWMYFNLVQYFGDVPLVLNTDAKSSAQLPRVPIAQVNQQIIQDLLEAKNLLTTKYPSAERARINKNVVSAFLARVYFYQQNWPAAEAEATEVINSASYSLVTDLTKVFLNNSNETIWQISLAGETTPATIMGAQFIPASTTPVFALYDTLANTFEPNDQRKVNWTNAIDFSGKTYYYPYKYKVRSTTTGNEYPVMLRLAEMYLVRSEARANQNNLSGAIEDINMVRERAGTLPVPSTATKEEILAVLEHERWVELFTESGDRWFNLKRLNKAKQVLKPVKPLWEGEDRQLLYPIPQQAMQSNPNLEDNPGY